jgi:hypothetical protein
MPTFSAARSRRLPGVTMHDAYGQSRFEMATQSQRGLTTEEVRTQRVLELDATALGEPSPRRPWGQRARRPSPLMRFRDEVGTERVSIDAVDEEDDIDPDEADEVAQSLQPTVQDGVVVRPPANAPNRAVLQIDPSDGLPARTGVKMKDAHGRRRSELRPEVSVSSIDGNGNTRMQIATSDEPNQTVADAIDALSTTTPTDRSSTRRRPVFRQRRGTRPTSIISVRDNRGFDRITLDAVGDDSDEEAEAEFTNFQPPENRTTENSQTRRRYRHCGMRAADAAGHSRVMVETTRYSTDPSVKPDGYMSIQDEREQMRTQVGGAMGLLLLDSNGTTRMIADTLDDNNTAISLIDANGLERSRLSAKGDVRTFDEEGLDRFMVDGNGEVRIMDGAVESISLNRFGITGFDPDGNVTLAFDRMDGDLIVAGRTETERRDVTQDTLRASYAEYCSRSVYSNPAAMHACQSRTTSTIMSEMGVAEPTDRHSTTDRYVPPSGSQYSTGTRYTSSSSLWGAYMRPPPPPMRSDWYHRVSPPPPSPRPPPRFGWMNPPPPSPSPPPPRAAGTDEETDHYTRRESPSPPPRDYHRESPSPPRSGGRESPSPPRSGGGGVGSLPSVPASVISSCRTQANTYSGTMSDMQCRLVARTPPSSLSGYTGTCSVDTTAFGIQTLIRTCSALRAAFSTLCDALADCNTSRPSVGGGSGGLGGGRDGLL